MAQELQQNLLGNRVYFRKKGTQDFVECPEHFWIVVDTKGAFWNRCNIGICPAVTEKQILRDRGPGGTIYIEVGHLCGCGGQEIPSLIKMPPGRWEKIATVDQILYDRPDVGAMVHDYDVPVPLYRKKGGEAYCVALPDGCVVDRRGFVRP